MHQRTVGWIYNGLLANSFVQRGARRLARYIGSHDIETVERQVALRGLPAAADGLAVLHVSDLHLHAAGPDCNAIIDAANSLAPDIVAYTGDFLNNDEGIGFVADLLASMPRGRGAFAVLGNHDYWADRHQRNDVSLLSSTLESCGVSLLVNEQADLSSLFGLRIAGVDDPVTGAPDIRIAMPDDDQTPTILLAHSPDIVHRLERRRPMLVLAGHTHGGQIRLPRFGPIVRMARLPRSMMAGLTDYHGVRLHVSPGIGCSAVDLRVRCPPELTLLRLCRVCE